MCNVLRLSLVQEKLEATTANCCFKYKADLPALPETISQQQCNAARPTNCQGMECKQIERPRSCKAHLLTWRWFGCWRENRHGRLASRNFLDLGMQAGTSCQANRRGRGKNKDEPFLSRLLPPGPTTHREYHCQASIKISLSSTATTTQYSDFESEHLFLNPKHKRLHIPVTPYQYIAKVDTKQAIPPWQPSQSSSRRGPLVIVPVMRSFMPWTMSVWPRSSCIPANGICPPSTKLIGNAVAAKIMAQK